MVYKLPKNCSVKREYTENKHRSKAKKKRASAFQRYACNHAAKMKL